MDYWGGGGGGAKGYVAPPPLKLLGGPGPPLPTPMGIDGRMPTLPNALVQQQGTASCHY